jgi:hypothetical protein
LLQISKGNSQLEKLEKKDDKVKKINEVLNGIRVKSDFRIKGFK